jgi:outer membrane receptor protein involved in Fe transport
LNFDPDGRILFFKRRNSEWGVFYKSITDPIFQDSFIGNYNGINGVQFTAPNNGKAASLSGIELGINRRFDFLPGFLQYFGTQLNATFMDSEMVKPGGRKVKLPYQAKELYNVQLFFEKKDSTQDWRTITKGNMLWNMRKMISMILTTANTAVWISEVLISLPKSLLYADVNNILNKPLIYHFGKDETRPEQVEYYGVRCNLGIKLNF